MYICSIILVLNLSIPLYLYFHQTPHGDLMIPGALRIPLLYVVGIIHSYTELH
jgi:hypothetical protein